MMQTRRSVMFGLLGTLCAPSIARAGVQVDGGRAFGSSWRITLGSEVPISAVRPAIEAIVAEVDHQMSPYRAASDLSRFNAAETTDWQPMPNALCSVAATALRVARLTGGAFDPTVGPVVSRLGFGPITGRVGHFSGIEARQTALRKSSPQLTLDLCGIAKGHALDRITEALHDLGARNALIELGGEVRALGHYPEGRDWYVAIADPRPQSTSALAIIAPGSFALATSGHAINGVTGPVATSHIIDPRRKESASTRLRSVSVLAPTATEADALATALCAQGPEGAVALARELNLSALLCRDTETGLTTEMTGRFADHLRI